MREACYSSSATGPGPGLRAGSVYLDGLLDSREFIQRLRANRIVGYSAHRHSSPASHASASIDRVRQLANSTGWLFGYAERNGCERQPGVCLHAERTGAAKPNCGRNHFGGFGFLGRLLPVVERIQSGMRLHLLRASLAVGRLGTSCVGCYLGSA